MLTIKEILQDAALQFSSITETPVLDAELLLAHVLKCSRTVFHTWPQRTISQSDYQLFSNLSQQHAQGVPVAYLIGKQEFWKFSLKVTPTVLIPRPETELLVEVALQLFAHQEDIAVVDLGTGSGAVALALAYEQPSWQITAVDTSATVLAIAQENAKQLGLSRVHWAQSNWFAALANQQFNLIVSNPPYIAPGDPHLAALQYEPQNALVAADQGLAALREIIGMAPLHLLSNGCLVLEHGYNQAQAVQELMQQSGFVNITTYNDLSGNPRVTAGVIN